MHKILQSSIMYVVFILNRVEIWCIKLDKEDFEPVGCAQIDGSICWSRLDLYVNIIFQVSSSGQMEVLAAKTLL